MSAMDETASWKMDAWAAEDRAAGRPPPDLSFSYPDCTVCDDGGDMDYDDGFLCQKCGTSWSRSGSGSEWGEEQ